MYIVTRSVSLPLRGLFGGVAHHFGAPFPEGLGLEIVCHLGVNHK